MLDIVLSASGLSKEAISETDQSLLEASVDRAIKLLNFAAQKENTSRYHIN